jgi:hypothetical protein
MGHLQGWLTSELPVARKITRKDFLQLLADIDSKSVRLTPRISPQVVYWGEIDYDVSNGWKIRILEDCLDFKSVVCVTAPDGRQYFPKDGYPSYGPPDEICREQYRLPGFGNWSCEACKELTKVLNIRSTDFTVVCKECLGTTQAHPWPHRILDGEERGKAFRELYRLARNIF